MKRVSVWGAGALLLAAGGVAGAAHPTVEQQLQQLRVQPNSALEALIRDNQDFSLLREDEFSTTRPELPPWLKVLWKKSHPNEKFDANDPTGGYPLVLREVKEWMVKHQDLRAGLPEPSVRPGDDPLRASVTGETRVSGPQTAPRSESDIRVNYWNTQKILSASNNISGSGGQAQFFSLDGGATWGQNSLPIRTDLGDSFHSDPTVDWTSDGRAWTSTLGINNAGTTLRLRNYVSTDNGATWTLDATPSGSQSSVDKQQVWVDHSATSSCKDYQYAIWHNGNPAFMSTRNATTNTWSAPVQVSGAETTGTAIGSDVKANSAGDAFGFWPTTGNRKLLVTKSTNCGTSWGTPVQIATTFDGFDIGVPAFASRRALIYVSGGTYRTATKNLVYAAWTDLSGDAGCTAAANEPGSNAASTCKTRIWFSRSTDGGATWAPAVKINNQPSLNDQFNQALVVDETSGAVGIAYYDTVADAGRKKVDMYWQSSFNDGQTWSAPVKVTTSQTDETSAGADSGNQFGDYNSVSGIAGSFFPSWTDRRANAREEIWTAKVLDAACTAPAAPTAGTATASAPNQVTLTFANGTPAATQFNVYRAQGTCAAPGTFTRVAAGIAGSPYTDNTVSGGITYAYRVSGAESTGNCESAQSTCVDVTATGACTLAPTFAGLASATSANVATCTNDLAWAAGTAQCGGPATYSVYRSTTAGFTPSTANRIASGITGTTFADADSLTDGTAYFYKVRARDGTTLTEDANTVERSATPRGVITSSNVVDTFEAASGFDTAGWTHAALSGANDWTWSTAQAQTPTHSWASASLGTASQRVLVSPSFSVLPNTTLSFFHTFRFEGSVANCYDAGTLEVSSDGGATWTVLPDAAFTAGGFNGTANPGFGNPIGGKRAWCSGTIGAMTQVTANLGSFAGQAIKLRWDEGDDSSTAATGWFVDSVTIANAGTAGVCSSGGAASFVVTPNAVVNGTISPSDPQTVLVGQTIAFTLTPDDGYSIGTVTGCNGTLVGNVYTTGPVNGACAVDATFVPDELFFDGFE